MKRSFNINSPREAQELAWLLTQTKAKLILKSDLPTESKVRLICFVDEMANWLKE